MAMTESEGNSCVSRPRDAGPSRATITRANAPATSHQPLATGPAGPGSGLRSWRKLRRPLFQCGLYGSDFLSPLLALLAAHELRFSRIPLAASWSEVMAVPSTQLVLLVTMLAHVFLMRQVGLYRLHKTWLPLDFALRLVFIETATVLIFIVATRALHTVFASRMVVVYYWLILTSLTISLKLGARAVVLLMLCFDIGVKKAVIVGNTETAHRLQRALQIHPQLGYRVIGVLQRGGGNASFEATPYARVTQGSASQVFSRLLQIWPDVVIIATSARRNDEILNLIAQCTSHGLDVRLVPEFFDSYSTNVQIDRLGVIPMVHLRSFRIPPFSAAVKRALDLGFALPLLPIVGLAAASLRPRAKRLGVPVFEKTPRVGLNGARFGLYRFTRALWSRPVPSVPPAWWVLLPQLLNVVRGDLSVVGPRAAEPERAAHYSSWEKRMLSVRPGLMGFTEANEAVSTTGMAEQMAWDAGYLDQQSAAFDLNVILTALPGLVGHPRRVVRNDGTQSAA